MIGKYLVCSGQGPNRDRWAICLSDYYYSQVPWWRAESRNGRLLTYATRDQAERKRLTMESEPLDARAVEAAKENLKSRAAHLDRVHSVRYRGSYFHPSCCDWSARPMILADAAPAPTL